VSPQLELVHTAVACAAALHIVPHAPQFAVSVFEFTHAPWQFTVPAGQFDVHFPLEQTWFARHDVPHAPQLLGSVSVFTHAEPHFAYPTLQEKSQAPAAQVAAPFAGALQACPHVPQSFGLIRASTHPLPQS
jgi:hypothetical protein